MLDIKLIFWWLVHIMLARLKKRKSFWLGIHLTLFWTQRKPVYSRSSYYGTNGFVFLPYLILRFAIVRLLLRLVKKVSSLNNWAPFTDCLSARELNCGWWLRDMTKRFREKSLGVIWYYTNSLRLLRQTMQSRKIFFVWSRNACRTICYWYGV